MATAKKQDQTPSHGYTEVKTLLSWESPGRPFKKRDKSYFATSLLIMLFIEIILFLFSQYMLMLVVASLVFVAFALATTPPHNFHYRISSEGFFVEDHFFLWQELYDFYFAHESGQEVLKLRTVSFYPGEITITLENVTVDQVRSALLPYLAYREYIKPTFAERTGNWMSKTFPLETQPQAHTKKIA